MLKLEIKDDEKFPEHEFFMDLESSIKEIYKRKPMSKERYMMLYHKTYDYCIRSPSMGHIYVGKVKKTLYVSLHSKIRGVLKDYLENLGKQLGNLIEEDLLNRYIELWEEYRFSSKAFNGICSYLNRQWQKQEKRDGHLGVFEVYQLSLLMWWDHVCKNLSDQMTKLILKLIACDRCGDPINTRLVSGILNCFLELGLNEADPYSKDLVLTVYQNVFESAFLKETESFYERESCDFLLNNSFTEYMKKVKERLQEEDKRAEVYLHISTKAPLIKICEKVLIENHMDSFASEFVCMLQEDRVDDLNRMFELLSRVPHRIGRLAVILESYINRQGQCAIEKVADDADPKLFIRTIIDIHKKYTDIVQEIFKADRNFMTSVDKACKSFINHNVLTIKKNDVNKSAELLAKYCDLLLKKSRKNPEDEELEEALNQAMIVFKYIEDKDVFVKYYIKLLAKRLIQQISASDDAEASMIAKLKESCGFEFTNKLQRMFQDIEVSKDLNDQFKKHLKSSCAPSAIDFSVQVLTSVMWTLKQSISFSLPPQMECFIQNFTDFYSNQHSGRRLLWQHNISSGEICTNCFKNKYVFQASTFQIAVLLQFNNSLSLTLQQLQEATQIEMAYLIQVIQILIKVKLLVQDKEEELTASSNINLFTDYKNKRMRVNINLPLRIEQKIEQEGMEHGIQKERNILIQAAIVRIMKMRKSLKHQELIMEVFTQLSSQFKPSLSVIKKNIGMLIEKEYLERTEGEKDMYNYLA